MKKVFLLAVAGCFFLTPQLLNAQGAKKEAKTEHPKQVKEKQKAEPKETTKKEMKKHSDKKVPEQKKEETKQVKKG